MPAQLSFQMRATLWHGENVYDLNRLIAPDSGWTLLQALDMNNSSQMVVVGINGDGLQRGVLLTPVPEPHSYLLLRGGIIAIA